MIRPRRTSTWPFLVTNQKKEERLLGVRQLVGALVLFTKAVPRHRTPKRCLISLTWVYEEIEIEDTILGVVERVTESENVIEPINCLLKGKAQR